MSSQQNLLEDIDQLESQLFLPTDVETNQLPELRLIDFCLKKLGVKKPNLEYLPNSLLVNTIDYNDIPYRIVDTPRDLVENTYSILIVFDLKTNLPAALFRKGSTNWLFNPYAEEKRPLNQSDQFKERSIEIYASLPEKAFNLFSILKFAFSEEIVPIVLLFIAAAVAMLFNLSIPMLTNYLVGSILPQSDSQLLIETTTVVLLIILGSSIVQYLKTLMTLRLETVTDHRLQTAVMDRLVRLPMTFISKFTTADLASRVNSISQIRQALGTGVITTLISSLFSLTYFVLMFQYDPELAIYAVILTVFSTSLILVLTWRSILLEKPLLEKSAEVTNFSMQAIMGLPQIRTSGKEPYVLRRWLKIVNQQASLRLKNNFYNDAKQQYAVVAIPISSVVIFAILTARLLNSGGDVQFDATTASFIAFNAAYASFNGSFASAVDIIADVSGRVSVLWGRVEPILITDVETGFKNSAVRKEISGSFEVSKLTYAFPDSQSLLFDQLSLSIPAGKYTAITGPSGCGKSTLMRFILGFLKPTSGEILVDGESLENLSIRSYRKQIGVVMQSASFNPGSIYDIICGGLHRSENEVWEALRKAAVDDEVRQLPMGLETLLTDSGSSLSGGQMQRIAIARALMNNPSVLILDEATSALDNISQKIISDMIDQMSITRIAIAHRLSTIRHADQIIVLQKGKPVEIGTWEEHIEAGGYLSKINSLN